MPKWSRPYAPKFYLHWQNFRAYGRPKAGLGIRKKEKRKEKKKGRKREGEVNEYKNNSPFARHCVHSCIDCRPKALTTPHSSSEALFAEAVGRSPSMLSSARVRYYKVFSTGRASYWLACSSLQERITSGLCGSHTNLQRSLLSCVGGSCGLGWKFDLFERHIAIALKIRIPVLFCLVLVALLLLRLPHHTFLCSVMASAGCYLWTAVLSWRWCAQFSPPPVPWFREAQLFL